MSNDELAKKRWLAIPSDIRKNLKAMCNASLFWLLIFFKKTEKPSLSFTKCYRQKCLVCFRINLAINPS